MADFTFYFGATNGQTKGAIKRLDEPNVMLNYASYKGGPWDSIENLFIDSGGYSFIKGMGEYQTSHEEYLSYIVQVEPDLFALRDYPCEPDVLAEHDRTVQDHQQMTTDAHRELLDRYEDHGSPSTPVAVVQGRDVNEYLTHLDDLRDAGVLTDYLGIGSVCGRHAVKEIKPIVQAIHENTPASVKLHAFGTKLPTLRQREMVEWLDSMDSMAYSFTARRDAHDRGIMSGFRQHALHYLKMRREVLEILSSHETDAEQQSLSDFGTGPIGGVGAQ